MDTLPANQVDATSRIIELTFKSNFIYKGIKTALHCQNITYPEQANQQFSVPEITQNITITHKQNNEHYFSELLFFNNTRCAKYILKDEEIYNLREAVQAEGMQTRRCRKKLQVVLKKLRPLKVTNNKLCFLLC